MPPHREPLFLYPEDTILPVSFPDISQVLRGETTKPRDAKSLPTPGFWLQEAGRLHHYPDPIWLG